LFSGKFLGREIWVIISIENQGKKTAPVLKKLAEMNLSKQVRLQMKVSVGPTTQPCHF
jgi:hypothetical protein